MYFEEYLHDIFTLEMKYYVHKFCLTYLSFKLHNWIMFLEIKKKNEWNVYGNPQSASSIHYFNWTFITIFAQLIFFFEAREYKFPLQIFQKAHICNTVLSVSSTRNHSYISQKFSLFPVHFFLFLYQKLNNFISTATSFRATFTWTKILR